MTITRLLASAAVVAVLGMGAGAPAWGQDAGGGGRGIIGLPRPTPSPPIGYEYVWVAPVYQTVTDQNWVPQTVQWVQEWREISPGCYEQVWRQIVTPGHWVSSTRRVLVSAGHWELVAISPPPPPIMPPIIVEPPPIYRPVYPPPIVVRGPATVGVQGYASKGGEDLSQFSPLSEWPK